MPSSWQFGVGAPVFGVWRRRHDGRFRTLTPSFLFAPSRASIWVASSILPPPFEFEANTFPRQHKVVRANGSARVSGGGDGLDSPSRDAPPEGSHPRRAARRPARAAAAAGRRRPPAPPRTGPSGAEHRLPQARAPGHRPHLQATIYKQQAAGQQPPR